MSGVGARGEWQRLRARGQLARVASLVDEIFPQFSNLGSFGPRSVPFPDSAGTLRGAMETDSKQQIKNSRAAVAQALHTKERARGNKPASDGKSNMSVGQHIAALQALANGESVPYPASLRIVVHEGDRAPQGDGKEEKKAPGYSRNTSGGFFTS